MTHVPPPPPPGAPISSRPYSVHVKFEAGVNEALVNEALLHDIFAPFGEVVAVILPQGPGILASEGEGVNGACRRGYGFIHFTGSALGRQCAIEAIQMLQGQYVNGVRLQCAFSKKAGGPPRQPFVPSRGRIRHSGGGGMDGGGRGGNGGGGGVGGPGPAVVMHFHHHSPYADGGGELPPNNHMHMPMSMHMPRPGAMYMPGAMMIDHGSGSPSSVMNMGMGGPMGGGGPHPLPPGGGGGFFVDSPKMGNGGGGGNGEDGGGNGNTPNGRWIPPAASQQHQQHQGYRPDTPQLGGPSSADSYSSPPGGMYGVGPAAGPYGCAPYPDMQQQQSVPPPPHHRHHHHLHHNHHIHHHDHHLNQQQQHVSPEFFVEQAPYDTHMYPYHYYDNDPYMQQQHHPHHPHHHSPLAPGGGGVENLDGGAGMPHSAPYLQGLLTSNSSIGGEDMMMYGGMYMEACGP